MEDEECENTNEGAWRGDRLVGQMRYDPNYTEHDANPAKALARAGLLILATTRATKQ